MQKKIKLVMTWEQVRAVEPGEYYIVDVQALGLEHRAGDFTYLVEHEGAGSLAGFHNIDDARLFAEAKQAKTV